MLVGDVGLIATGLHFMIDFIWDGREYRMAKIKELDMENINELCDIGKALSVPIRVEILKLLYQDNLIIGEIAKLLDIPQSSAAFHLKLLEKAGLIRMEERPGSRGTMKVCSRKLDFLNICLLERNKDINEIVSEEMPVGAFTGCKVHPTCGLFSPKGVIGMEDTEYGFYHANRFEAGLFWTSAGYVEYKFANALPKSRRPKSITLSMEICSEAPGYREDWKSDITVWINNHECGTWTCPGDFGSKRGRLNPLTWADGSSQYGMLMTWEVRKQGSFINGTKATEIYLEELGLMDKPFISVRIGNKEDAKYIGGFNIFGKSFGNYEQDIVLSIEY